MTTPSSFSEKLPAPVRRMALPVLIVGLSIVGAQLLIASRPTAPKVSRDVKPTSVEVLTARVRDERAMLTAYGTVQAHQRLTVQPEVSGRVVRLNPHVVIGGIIPKGAALFQIDPRDYRVAVDEQRAALAKAEFDVKVEMGNQAIARREWDLLNPSAGEINALSRQLALRRPHLREKLIGLAAARSRLRKARLDLRRTIVRAPFHALVLAESVETGQLVNAQSTVATLVGTDEFRVQVSVPLHQLAWITFPQRDGQLGSPVQVIRDLGHGRTPAPGPRPRLPLPLPLGEGRGEGSVVRRGTVVELLGDVTQNGRMAQILVSVRDPLELEQAAEGRQPLLLGEYVRVAIEGPLLRDVTVLPRHAIREGSRVWINTAEQRLAIRQVDIVLFRQDTVLVGQGLQDGDEVIISHVPAAVPGLPLAVTRGRSVPISEETPSGDQTGKRPSPATGLPLALTKGQPAADPASARQ